MLLRQISDLSAKRGWLTHLARKWDMSTPLSIKLSNGPVSTVEGYIYVSPIGLPNNVKCEMVNNVK